MRYDGEAVAELYADLVDSGFTPGQRDWIFQAHLKINEKGPSRALKRGS